MNTMKALLSLLLLGVAIPAMASVAVPVSVEDLARGSDAVVRGRVERVTARWTEDGKSIFTYVDVRPSNVWRGSTPTLVTVAVPGGVVGDFGQRVGGAPTFSEGEEVVLFLSKLGESEFQVRGMAQGKFAVVKDEARPNLSSLAFVNGRALRAGERRAEPMSIDELERRVKATR
jgi:hypothetical protein